VKAGRWQASLGQDYSTLAKLRETGDYGVECHIGPEEAMAAVHAARRVLDAAQVAHPGLE
jgi:hypothetical protein